MLGVEGQCPPLEYQAPNLLQGSQEGQELEPPVCPPAPPHSTLILHTLCFRVLLSSVLGFHFKGTLQSSSAFPIKKVMSSISYENEARRGAPWNTDRPTLARSAPPLPLVSPELQWPQGDTEVGAGGELC